MSGQVDRTLTRRRTLNWTAMTSLLLAVGISSSVVRAQAGANACANAEPIAGEGPFLFDNTQATIDGLGHTTCNFFGQTQIDHDVWYCWTAPEQECPGGFVVSTCGETSVDTKIAVYGGCGTCPPATPLGCSDDDCGGQFRQTRTLFQATPGQGYSIRVGTFPGVGGGTGHFTITCATPPSNDDCEEAQPIAGQGFFPFDNIGATPDGPLHAECAEGRSPRTDHDVWFCWTAPCTGKVFAQTCDFTVVDTKLTVYEGCGCPATEGSFLTCNDDDACDVDSRQSRVGFDAVLGHNYLIRVGTFEGTKGGIGDLDIRCGSPSCPSAGSCFAPHAAPPGCSDKDCCERICAMDRFCCTGEWDAICARRASGVCGGAWNTCAPTSGTCDAQGGNGTPGCNDLDCCNAVCEVDPYCCLSEWDSFCTSEAGGICGGGFSDCHFTSGSCQGVPGNGTPGCNNVTCCNAICGDDPFCCIAEWDEVCAIREGTSCQIACGGSGTCFGAHAGAGCEDADCCQRVCDVDPFCCFSEWDILCAVRASLTCAENCPVGSVAWMDPPDGVVYAGYPFDPSSLTPLGPREFLVHAPPGASPGCFGLCETGQLGDPNAIVNVTPQTVSGGFQVYQISLARPITPGAVTMLRYTDNNSSVQAGTFTAHPANVDGDEASSAADILEMVNCCLNGACTPAWGAYSCDVDRSGATHPPDLIALIDLLNGAGPLTAWNGTALPTGSCE